MKKTRQRKAKNCAECRALKDGECILGFKIVPIYTRGRIKMRGYQPTELCPKPRTYAKLKELQDERPM